MSGEVFRRITYTLQCSCHTHTDIKSLPLNTPASTSQPQTLAEKPTVSRRVECVESAFFHVSRSQVMLCFSERLGNTASVVV